MRLIVTIAAIVLAQQSACDSSSGKSTPAKPVIPKPPLHRFVLTRLADEGVAFDTQTGQICKTWDWKPMGKSPTPDPLTGGSPQRIIGEFTPTCLSLYEKYPSGPSDVGVTEDQQLDQR
jgi:hypothetical protein